MGGLDCGRLGRFKLKGRVGEGGVEVFDFFIL